MPTITRSSPAGLRRWSPVAIALVCLALLGLQSARAADGPAPPSQERRVLAGVHTDAVSVFYEEDALVLGTRADVDGESGKRLDPDLVLFNVKNAAQQAIPSHANFAFLGTAGSTIWVAPQDNPGGAMLWPGISTEDVADAVLDGNSLTLSLDGFSGPGDFEMYVVSSVTEVQRLLSSTDVLPAWTLPVGDHRHMNWAFTATGEYTLTFSASATVAGVPVSATQAYTFLVGNVPSTVATTTALQANPTTLVQGNDVTLTATVTPSGAAGYVEFLNDETVIGHEAVTGGAAVLATSSLPIGTHSLTARFVPQWTNNFSPSSSTAVTVTVTDESGVPFSITGIQESYNVGDTLAATVVGYALREGETFRWLLRPIGATSMTRSEFIKQDSVSPSYSLVLDQASYDNYELAVVVRSGSTDLVVSDFVPIVVEPAEGVRPEIARVGGVEGTVYGGETFILSASSLDLAAGETARYAFRVGNVWRTQMVLQTEFTIGGTFEQQTFLYKQAAGEDFDFVVQVVKGGKVVRQSTPLRISTGKTEVMISGVQSLYREGATLQVAAVSYPDRENITYSWRLATSPTGGPTGSGGLGEGAEMTVNNLTKAAHDGKWLLLYVHVNGVYTGAVASSRIAVTDDLSSQFFYFKSLNVHYHQGDTVKLDLIVDPAPIAGDQIIWEWKWPGLEWEPFPGDGDVYNELVTEQALDGVQVRATLDFADPEVAPMVSEVTIYVDDHGAAARQQPTVGGDTSVTEGDTVLLTRVLPVNGPTILTDHRWEKKAAGSETWEIIPGQTGSSLSFTAALANDGAQYRVTIMKPNGQVAYGPSPAVTLAVSEGTGGPGEPGGSAVNINVAIDASQCFVTLGIATGSAIFSGGDLDDGLRAYAASLPEVTVTSSCAGDWTVNGQATDFTSSGSSFGSNRLGWTPGVVADNLSPGQALAGGSVASGEASSDGLKVSRLLGESQGGGAGTAAFDAVLSLRVPTAAAAGEYVSTLTLSVFTEDTEG